MIAWRRYLLCQVQGAQGRLDAAARTCQQALEVAAAPGRSPLPAAGPAYVGLGEVAYQRNELDGALRHVTEGIALCRQFVYISPLAAGLVTLAWTRQATGDPAGALEAIGEAGHASPGPAGLINRVPAQRARLLLAQGNVAAAVRWTQQHGLSADDEPSYPQEPEYLVLARVLLAQDRPGPALALLDRLHAAAVTQDRAGSVIEAGALRAEHGAARSVPLCCLARLLRAFDGQQAGPGVAAAAVPGMVEPLTARELEVLRLLAEGRSNQAIATELVVALDTVKKHVAHVLGSSARPTAPRPWRGRASWA